MPAELTTALTTGLTSLQTAFTSAVLLAVPVGFAIWAIKIGVRVAPSMVRGFIKR